MFISRGIPRVRTAKASIASEKQSLVIAGENRDDSVMFNFVPVYLEKSHYLDNQRKGFLLYRREGR